MNLVIEYINRPKIAQIYKLLTLVGCALFAQNLLLKTAVGISARTRCRQHYRKMLVLRKEGYTVAWAAWSVDRISPTVNIYSTEDATTDNLEQLFVEFLRRAKTGAVYELNFQRGQNEILHFKWLFKYVYVEINGILRREFVNIDRARETARSCGYTDFNNRPHVEPFARSPRCKK